MVREPTFREEDCEVWRQHGSDPGWRAKHKPTGIVIICGPSWREDRPPTAISGLREVVERHWAEQARSAEYYAALRQKIATENGWTVHCNGGCAECDWQGYLLPDGTPIPRKEAQR